MSDYKLARWAGVFYLIIIVCGIFSEGFVRTTLIVSGDAVATATNIAESAMLFRVGFVSDLVMVVADIAVSICFLFLLKKVSEPVAYLATFFRLAQAAVIAANLLNHFVPLLLMGSPAYTELLGESFVQGMTLLHLENHRHGYLISQVLFSFNCMTMSYLLMKSSLFPKALGWLVGGASLAYLVDALTSFIAPNYAETIAVVLVIPVVAELSLCLWLLIKGIRRAEMS